MNVMYLCDNSYSYIAGISILSLLDSNQDIDFIHIFLVGDAISEENKKKLYDTVNSKNRMLTILNKPDLKALMGENVEMHWWIENVFSKLFLAEVFRDFPEIEKLIYIDSDTLVTGNLLDLWNQDLENYVAAGVLEAMGDLHKKAIGLEQDDPYFNAGMFLVDLKKWRNENWDEKAERRISKWLFWYVVEPGILALMSTSNYIRKDMRPSYLTISFTVIRKQ